jgi:hypothetical protein
MIKIEKTDVFGWDAAIRGMRNPMNSWDKSDSKYNGVKLHRLDNGDEIVMTANVGDNDLDLMKRLVKAGDDHGKFLRMINVTMDITAPLYWWKEFDTYKVGTVANSCSTMHKIHAKEFTVDDFSLEHLTNGSLNAVALPTISVLNNIRDVYLRYDELNEQDPEGWEEGITCKKDLWWQMIQMLPSSYNQKRTVQLNYSVLKSIYFARRNHKLDEWHTLCDWMETLPYFKEICIDVESE